VSNPENPFDTTLWDPVDPEQAIEDPFHGPEATLRLLSTPPMPMKDGGYWVFGASSIVRTCTFDANGKPYIKFSAYSNSMEMMRFSQQITKWHEQLEAGELPEGYPENHIG
jgi:hypothetical protein